jgi:hypothetical protein
MNSSECRRIIRNFLFKNNCSESWIVSSPELPTDEEEELYELACKRLNEIKRIEDETEKLMIAKKEAKEQEMIKAINCFINKIGGINKCYKLVKQYHSDILNDGKAHIRKLQEENKLKEVKKAKDELLVKVSYCRKWENELQQHKTIQSSKDEFINFITIIL